MSETTDDTQLSTQPEVTKATGEAAPGVPLVDSDADDVEVLAQAVEAEPPAPSRHDSVVPTSRKLAPPPKPKRDSSNPGSVPPPAGDPLSGMASLKAPSAPSISFQDASVSSRDVVASALSGSESLRAIGEALSKDAGAFSTTETPTGGRPPVPRPRSQPAIAVPKEPSASDEAPPSTAPPKSTSIFAQRIISVGTPSERPPAPPKSAPVPQPAVDLDRTLPSEERPADAAPVVEHVQTAQPPLVAPAPPPVGGPLPALASAPAPAPSLASVPAPSPSLASVPAPSPSLASVPPPSPALAAVPPSSLAPAPAAFAASPSLEMVPPPLAPVSAESPASPVAPAASPVAPAASSSAFVEPHVTVDVQVDEGSLDVSGTDIPITTEIEDEEPTSPQASEAPLAAPAFAAPLIPDEPTPAPPPLSATAAAEAEPRASEDAGPDSADRLQVEELSREDSPSIPPDEPTPAMPPAAPPARAEAKPPPPPRRAPAPPREELTSPEVEKKKSKQKRPWWEELFSEDFVRANWKVSDEQIKREVTFVEESLGVAPGGVVLDLGCGSGQHAVELASRGYGVVGYDLSLYQLALAADIAQERSQKINFLQGDMREMAFEEMFDGIFCWNTSFGYFEEDKNFSVAERAFRALRPGGMFLVDVMNRDFVAAHTPSSVWFEGDACVCMDDAVIDYFTSRLRVKRSVILDDGRTRECTYSVRLYSFHELGKLLHEVGFRVTEVSGHPATPGVFLGQASPRILMLAQRP